MELKLRVGESMNESQIRELVLQRVGRSVPRGHGHSMSVG